jgi:hypothetical protein
MPSCFLGRGEKDRLLTTLFPLSLSLTTKEKTMIILIDQKKHSTNEKGNK